MEARKLVSDCDIVHFIMCLDDICEVFRMYKHYFDEMAVVPDMLRSDLALSVLTKENMAMKIAICNSGWYLLGEEEPMYYESFEAMMNVLSPGFRSDFGNELLSKLLELKKSEE